MWSKLSQKFRYNASHRKKSATTLTAVELRLSDSFADQKSQKSSHLKRDNKTPTPKQKTTPLKKNISNNQDEYPEAFLAFERQYPDYAGTSELDRLRKEEFTRLNDSNIVYADYMGGCLYPESLVKQHLERLTTGVYGNTHSDSPSSTASEAQVRLARSAVLTYFHASPEDYVCIFTANCTSALKLVGESFPFGSSSQFVLAEDSHNSVNGIRSFAERSGSKVIYLPALEKGGFNEEDMLNILRESRTEQSGASLVAITGQSNISGFRPHLPTLLSAAKNSGCYTLLDGAALASTSLISLDSKGQIPGDLGGKVDALAISFYKMFGYPTGVGALIARKDFLRKLKRPWFAGGTVQVVGIPCGVSESEVDWERFEEGTINYTSLMAIPPGLELLSRYIQPSSLLLPRRLRILHSWLHHSLRDLRHGNGTPLVTLLTPDPTSLPNNIRDGYSRTSGYVLSLIFHWPSGERIPNSEISRQAASVRISLRTGCVCNPGGAAGLLSLREQWVNVQEALVNLREGESLRFSDVEKILGWEVGVVRISLGLVSDFRDVWKIVKFASSLLQQ